MLQDFSDELMAASGLGGDPEKLLGRFEEFWGIFTKRGDSEGNVLSLAEADSYHLSKQEFLCFKGMFFLENALRIIEEIERGSAPGRERHDILLANVSLGSLIYGIVLSRVDIECLEKKEQLSIMTQELKL
jgi:hypothetical protein